MSVANLLQDNNYAVYAKSITADNITAGNFDNQTRPYASSYCNNNTDSTVIANNLTYFQVTFGAGKVNSAAYNGTCWELQSDGRWKYVYSVPQNVLISASISATHGQAANQTLGFSITRNGSNVGTQQRFTVGPTPDYNSCATNCTITASNGDLLGISVRNFTGANNVVVSEYSLVVD